MIALVCLLIPPLILVLVREKVNNGTIRIGKAALSYPIWVLILNGLMILILYLFFDNYGQLFAKLNRSRIFACKYFALSLVLALAEPWAKKLVKLVKKMYETVKPFFGKVYHAVETIFTRIGETTRKQIRTVAFLAAAAIAFSVCNDIAQPIWTDWNNYNTMRGFYEEPENTIETIFIGSSVTVNGIIPMELYENYGICAYNLGTVKQPMLASYYWAEEAYRLHSETLTTIVLDVSKLRDETDEAFYRWAIDHMEFSEVKLRAVQDYSALFDEETFLNLIPLLSYHDRWEELDEEDFTKSEIKVDVSTRGYNYVMTKHIDTEESYTALSLPSSTLDEDAEEMELCTESLYYLKKLISFCEEHDIQLVLTKVPTSKWSSSAHNAVQKIADEYGLDFIDFNYDPYFSELGFNYAYDFVDTHMNYYGATKFTNCLGNYLITECGNHDVRGDEDYAFMEAELEEYHRLIAQVDLNDITDPAEYISYLFNQGDYTIFISVKNTASSELTQEQRDYFASVGLTKLSELTYRASYLAVIDDGTVIVERSKKDPGTSEEETATEEEKTPINDMEHIEEIFAAELEDDEVEEEEESLTLSYTGALSDGTDYEIFSGGRNLGNTSSILIDGTEYSKNTRGLNIVVYDNERQEVIDQVCFDTHASSERETLNYAIRLEEIKESGASLSELSGIDCQLYLYDRKITQTQRANEIAVETGEDDLLAYLAAYWNESGCEIYISVKGEAADAMTEDVRDALAELGLSELAALESGDSYLAVAGDGVVAIEKRDHGDSQIELSIGSYSISSGGTDSGNSSSIRINGTEYSQQGDGINIVVYDTELEEVLSQVTFATGTVSQSVDG